MGKKVLMTGLMLTILLACFSGAQAKQSNWNDQALVQITSVMQQSDIDIKNWSLYGKSTSGFVSDFTGYVNVVESLQAKSPSFNWEKIIESNEHWSVTGFNIHSSGIKERVSVFAYPHKKQYKTYIIYEVEGHDWNSQVWDSFKPEFRKKVQWFLGESPSIYTCVQGTDSGTIDIVLQKMAKQLVQSFNATTVEALYEETFLSLSAYTDQWKHSILTDQQKMNLQIGLRTHGIGGKTTITIGTPIITTEY
ncbi:YwmB family TATA-box binding protein [Alkalihalobacillus sp. AL-G]|uniref:YwmB family TATA-box binding protein n=1 Tax=Alkalihalobacillus sp. AL-G TaxID=2926399 RepID=UPI00272A2A46|nr:YwmB family TATA-box binding protein [Alkalihalobacillus sp. AL-G]WLD93141.1 YwmB family TATA-box binding protein [Alkalihalobacillus sp. AL-G]